MHNVGMRSSPRCVKHGDFMHTRCLCSAHSYHDTCARVALNLPPGAAFVDEPPFGYYIKPSVWPDASKLPLQKRFGVVIPNPKRTAEPKPEPKRKPMLKLKSNPEPKPGAKRKLKDDRGRGRHERVDRDDRGRGRDERDDRNDAK